jgi:hypothetical protein
MQSRQPARFEGWFAPQDDEAGDGDQGGAAGSSQDA